MIPAHKLIPSQSLRRYDEDGEPLYTATERVLLAMRRFDYDWVEATDVFDAMELYTRQHNGRNACDRALSRLVENGRVERDGRYVRLARVQPAMIHIEAPVEKDRSKPVPVDMLGKRRAAKAAYVKEWRRNRRQQGICYLCNEASQGRPLCSEHLAARRQHAVEYRRRAA